MIHLKMIYSGIRVLTMSTFSSFTGDELFTDAKKIVEDDFFYKVEGKVRIFEEVLGREVFGLY